MADDKVDDVIEEDEHCVIVQLANDHDHIKGLFRKFKDPALSDDAHQNVVWQMVRELCLHMHAQEEVLCPVLGEEIGESARQHSLDVDESLKMLLADIDGMKVGDDGLKSKVEQLMAVFFEHMTEEEHLMPELREAVGEARLLELGTKFRAAKQHVPTRPHPSAPNSIFYRIAAAPIDYIRDRFRFGNATAAL